MLQVAVHCGIRICRCRVTEVTCFGKVGSACSGALGEADLAVFGGFHLVAVVVGECVVSGAEELAVVD